MVNRRTALARDLFNIGAIKFGAFRLKLHEKNPDAPLSPIYIDLRVLRSFPGVLRDTAYALCQLTDPLPFDLYADVPTASTPIVTLMSSTTSIPMISPRIGAKGHGTMSLIDGVYQPGQVVLVVDDLITTSASKLEAISVLESAGLYVKDVAVLVDREQGGGEELRDRGYQLFSVFTLRELLGVYKSLELINQETHERVVEYLQAPQPK